MPGDSSLTVKSEGLDGVPVADSSREAVLHQLSRILESESFQNSRRSKSLLTHLVRSSLDGISVVKERSIAIDVFGRGPDYEPAEDSIVRVSVHELRRRLQRYYEHEGAGDDFRIELPQETRSIQFYASTTDFLFSCKDELARKTGYLVKPKCFLAQPPMELEVGLGVRHQVRYATCAAGTGTSQTFGVNIRGRESRPNYYVQ